MDYDCKKRQGVTDKELKQAEDKFAESLHLAQMGMFNILEADIEQITQLMQFAEALLEYHRQCSEILQVRGFLFSSKHVIIIFVLQKVKYFIVAGSDGDSVQQEPGSKHQTEEGVRPQDTGGPRHRDQVSRATRKYFSL